MELVWPSKLSTSFLSLISALEPYSFQYVADVSQYSRAKSFRVRARNFF